MNEALEKIAAEAAQENTHERLVLIDDIIRVKKFLFGQGLRQHNEFLTDQGRTDLFDSLYEYSIDSLRIIYKGYEKQYEAMVRQEYDSYKHLNPEE